MNNTEFLVIVGIFVVIGVSVIVPLWIEARRP